VFKYRSGDQLSQLRFFMVFLSPSRQYLKIRPKPLLSTSFTMYHLPIILSFDAI
jgi:hypothetical protein